MIGELLPRRADNAYRGHKIALWIFGLVAAMRAVIGFNCTFHGRMVATSADAIPLDTFTPTGADAFVSAFALLGLTYMVGSLLGFVVLFRYRTLVPLIFALNLLQQLGGRVILRVMPIARIGAPPGSIVNVAFLSLTIVGLALSLWVQEERVS